MRAARQGSSRTDGHALISLPTLTAALAFALALLLLVTLGACDIRTPGTPDVPVAGQADPDSADDSCCGSDEDEATPDDGVTDDADDAGDTDAGATTVIVPDVLGLWPDQATDILEAAGLGVEEVDVHGPVDPDAGDIGRVYRQTPTVAAEVPVGTVVEIRYWWESQ
jgi:hypothetical protein